MVNTKIKEFDTKIGNFINEQLANGMDISTLVIVLDKYLLSAKIAEMDILKQEEEIEKQMLKQEANCIMPENDDTDDSIPASPDPIFPDPEKEWFADNEIIEDGEDTISE